jgi:hypothetical protein
MPAFAVADVIWSCCNYHWGDQLWVNVRRQATSVIDASLTSECVLTGIAGWQKGAKFTNISFLMSLNANEIWGSPQNHELDLTMNTQMCALSQAKLWTKLRFMVSHFYFYNMQKATIDSTIYLRLYFFGNRKTRFLQRFLCVRSMCALFSHVLRCCF